MQKGSLAVIAAAAVIALSGCAPTDTEIADVRSQVVETFRHQDSLCVGLPYEVRHEFEFEAKFLYSDNYWIETPYADCLEDAPAKSWREAGEFCESLNGSQLAESCWSEAEKQFISRLPAWKQKEIG